MSKADYVALYGDKDVPRRGATRCGQASVLDFGDTWREAKREGFVNDSKVRLEALYNQEGRCYICGVEEWRTKKRLGTHRIVPGKDGGTYTLDNIVLLCARCHHHAEGRTREEIDAMKRQGGVK